MLEAQDRLIVYLTPRGNEVYYWPQKHRLAVELLQMPFLIAHGHWVTYMMANGVARYRIVGYTEEDARYHLECENAEVWMTE